MDLSHARAALLQRRRCCIQLLSHHSKSPQDYFPKVDDKRAPLHHALAEHGGRHAHESRDVGARVEVSGGVELLGGFCHAVVQLVHVF
jgi:hypothetical protein